ncbi:MAG: hypothetical protein ACM3ML_01225 [Micromonosporaceae bacterium]
MLASASAVRTTVETFRCAPLADEGGHRYWPEPVDEPVEEQQEDDEAEDVPVAIWIARTVTVTRPARQ